MPITVPAIDERRYADLLNEAIARIPVHNPDWTNFNRSDPGITLVELFAFLTESLLYRANQIPERNRRKFLSLLGVPLRPAAAARGIVTLANSHGPLRTVTLNGDVEVRAGQVPFRTDAGLDVLPVEARAYYKRPVPLTATVRQLYEQLYASFLVDGLPGEPPTNLSPYEPALLDGSDPDGVDLVAGTADGALWVALLARPGEEELIGTVRAELAGKTLNLGVVPVVAAASATLPPGGTGGVAGEAYLEYAFPVAPQDGRLPDEPRQRVATYAVCAARDTVNVLLHPGVVQVSLPAADGLSVWRELEPLEDGADGFPPAIDDPRLAARLVTWLRVRALGVGQARVLWAGVNAATVTQRARVGDEVLPDGTGQPDQSVQLARTPVLPGSVSLTVTVQAAASPPATPDVRVWEQIDDLLAAGPEVPVPDPLLPPGAPQPPAAPADVYVLDAEAGVIRFGDGLRGRRPPPGAVLRASYDYTLGRDGNLGAGSITSGPALPAGFAVGNPVRTWGGADAETVPEGEKQVARYLQHRDRLVTAADFETVTRRTPGVEIARVDVLAAYDPQLTPNLPGSAPGAVTLMIVPRYDPAQPEAPRPDRLVLDAICQYLNPRRLVTTELILRGPDYLPIWVSVGIDVRLGASIADVRERVAAELRRVLSPLPLAAQPPSTAQLPPYAHAEFGWPLRSTVSTAELAAFATRVDGVRVVNGVLVAKGGDDATDAIPMTGLKLPRLAGISVVQGDPLPLAQLRGAVPPAGPARTIPVPVVPEGC